MLVDGTGAEPIEGTGGKGIAFLGNLAKRVLKSFSGRFDYEAIRRFDLYDWQIAPRVEFDYNRNAPLPEGHANAQKFGPARCPPVPIASKGVVYPASMARRGRGTERRVPEVPSRLRYCRG